MKKTFIFFVLSMAFISTACMHDVEQQPQVLNLEDDKKETEDMDKETVMEKDEVVIEVVKKEPNLSDVTKGATILGVMTDGKATGYATAIYEQGTYSMDAIMDNLPDPNGTDFYEGWVVRKSPLSVISTGKATKVGDQYINNFESSEDLTDHNLYVLTIEPDDNNPAPADHILEGNIN